MPYSVFSLPTPMKISGRSSSITNAFVNSIIPVVFPSEAEIVQALAALGMTVNTISCAYCGDAHSEWDHFRPLIKDKRPTGYISEINNLVPSCGKCNQSKGNKNWDVWIESSAKKSPKSRNIADIKQRIQRLRNYEKIGAVTKLNFDELVTPEKWAQHWKNWEQVLRVMDEAQLLANELRLELAQLYR